MAQTFQDAPSTEKIRESRPKILDRDEALRSSFSGTSHPTSPSPIDGQFSYRTDEKKLYHRRGSAWIPTQVNEWAGTQATLVALDAAATHADGALIMLLGLTTIGDIPPAILRWSASSSATADSATVWRPTTGAASTGNGRWLRVAADGSRTFTNGDATPSIANGAFFITAGTPPASITDFDDGYEGQLLVIQRGSADQVITHDASLIDLGGSNLTLTTAEPRALFVHVAGVYRLLGRDASSVVGVFNVKAPPFGATGDGTTNDTSAVQAAINAAAAAFAATGAVQPVYFPPGIYNCATLEAKDGTQLIGAGGMGVSTIRLRNSTNGHLIATTNADSLFGGTTDGGINRFGIFNLTLDGNRANNTSGDVVKIFGYAFRMRSVYVRNAPRVGINSKWGTPASIKAWGGEAVFEDIYIIDSGREGILFDGPNDSQFNDVFIVNASQENDNAYDAFWVKKNARLRGVHVWRYDPPSFGTKVARTACRIDADGVDASGCHFEGMYTANIEINGTVCSFAGDNRYYAAHNGVNILVRKSGNKIAGNLLGPAPGAPACKGIVLGSSGDTVADCMIDVTAVNQNAGVVDFTNSSGRHSIRIRGDNASGTFLVGTPAGTDVVDIVMAGSGGGRLSRDPAQQMPQASVINTPLRWNTTSGIAAAGTNQAGASALDNGLVLHNVTSVASGTGVRLFDALRGGVVIVSNMGANALAVYPDTGDAINNLSANAAFSVPAGKVCQLVAPVDNFWIALLGA